jgi:hypothetical protein
MRRAVCTITSDYWGLREGDEAEIVRTYWRNGEHHHRLRRADGTTFESPAIFWNDEAE